MTNSAPMPLVSRVQIDFMDAWRSISSQVYAVAHSKGFHEASRADYIRGTSLVPRHNAVRMALIHSEVSEALEAIRNGNPPDDKISSFSGAEAELADVVIRIMDLAEVNGWDISRAIVAKIEFNRTRSEMHGGKLF